MGFIEQFFIGVSLSMDAFAAALCKGLNMPKLNKKFALIIATFFGVFQALMPLIGWILGKQFEKYITGVDHWIAFGLLAIIGGKMIIDVIKDDERDSCSCSAKLNIKEIFFLAIATSIDALAIGITFAFLKVNILYAILLIGVTTFSLSLVGVFIGHRFGAKFKSKAEIAGGAVLILIGLKILLEHLGFIDF